MHETSWGSRKSKSTKSLWSILTLPARQSSSPADLAQAKPRLRLDWGQHRYAKGWESLAMAAGLWGLQAAGAWCRGTFVFVHSHVCSHLRHLGTPSSRRATQSCGRALQAGGAQLGETELNLRVKKVRSLCVSQTPKITSLEPLYLISFPRLCGPRQAAARLSSAKCHPYHLAWGPGLLWTVFQAYAQKFHKPENTHAPPPTQARLLVNAGIQRASTDFGNKDVQLINLLGVIDEQEKAH